MRASRSITPRRTSRAFVVAGVIAVASTLAGCSINTVIWGPDGSAVIDKTNAVIAAAAKGQGQTMACSGSSPDFRRPSDWAGVNAEEPAGDDKSGWGINLSKAAHTGDVIPQEIDFNGKGEDLCVAKVYWGSVIVD
jgi:hypothetical protein